MAAGRTRCQTVGVSDQAIRELERAAAADGPAARLQLAAALERAGRADEVIDALLPARGDPQVRRRLSAAASFAPEGGPGRARRADVAPVTAPRHLWTHRPPRRSGCFGLQVLPHIVAARLGTRGVVLDAVTGEERWVAPTPVRQPWVLLGPVIVLKHRRAVVAHDAWTGERRWELEASAGVMLGRADPDLLLLLADSRHVVCLRVDAADPARPPVEVWRVAPPRASGRLVTTLAGADRVAVCGDRVMWVEARTGRPAPAAPGSPLAIDAHGVLVEAAGGGVAVHDCEGRLRCVAPAAGVRAVDEHVVFLQPRDGAGRLAGGLQVLDRSTGERRDLATSPRRLGALGACARGVLFAPGWIEAGGPERPSWVLTAVDAAGEQRWTFDPGLPPTEWGVDAVAVGPRRVYVATGRGTIVAIGDA